MNCSFAAAALVLGLSTSAFAVPPNMPLAAYMARVKQLNADFAADRSACRAKGSAGNGIDVCLADATGRDHVAKADLEVEYRSTPQTRLEANDARVAAAYWSARERCANLDFSQQPGCLQDAKTAEVSARARSKAEHARVVAEESRALARARESHAAAQARARKAADARDAAQPTE